MVVTGRIDEVRDLVRKARKENRRIGFVPTMGYLHKGHASLVEVSKRHADFQVMSIFVNRKQFNNPDDFRNYPKDIEKDLLVAEKSGVDLVFVPDDAEMYQDNLITVHMERLTDNLCGAHRAGHFDGVFLVVSKLFNIVQPDVAVFGQKDIQQVLGIKKMVADLNFPVGIIVAPIIREEEGLAMSSRNKHLKESEKKNALMIYESLRKAEALLLSGERDALKITGAALEVLKRGKPDKIDYYSLVKYSDLSETGSVLEKSVIAVAAYFGTTRLIDNMIVEINKEKVTCIY